MKHLRFKRGEFITQAQTNDESFAIFEGNVYEPSNGEKGPLEYSLMCFYDPDHYEQDSEGNYKRQYVFECDVDDETCEYFIDENDLSYWRSCTNDEINKALKFLAEIKHIAFDEKTKTFRKLSENEKISFSQPKSTGYCGGNVQHRGSESYMGGLNPFYKTGTREIEHPVANAKKYITRVVDENWEQKEPISNMSEEHTTLVNLLCEKLKFAFQSNFGTITYPINGKQVPRRIFDSCGWSDEQYAGMFGNYCGWGEYD